MNFLSKLVIVPALVLALIFSAVYFLFSLDMALKAAGAAGALCLLVILFAARRRGGPASDEAVPPPAGLVGEIALQRKRRRHPRYQAKTTQLAKQLTANGFVSAGFFRVKKQDIYLEGLAHATLNAYAVVYDCKTHGVWVDMMTPYEDGGSYCVTTASPEQMAGPRDPKMRVAHVGGHTVIKERGTKKGAQTVTRMIDRLMDERPEGEFEPVDPDDFKEYFEDRARREHEWLAERGMELRELEDALFDEFYRKTDVSEEEREEGGDDYYLVHDRLPVREVARRLDIPDDMVREGDTPMALVERVLEADRAQFVVAAKLESPAPAYMLAIPEEAVVDVCEVEDDAGIPDDDGREDVYE